MPVFSSKFLKDLTRMKVSFTKEKTGKNIASAKMIIDGANAAAPAAVGAFLDEKAFVTSTRKKPKAQVRNKNWRYTT